jgi:hypothetical protein
VVLEERRNRSRVRLDLLLLLLTGARDDDRLRERLRAHLELVRQRVPAPPEVDRFEQGGEQVVALCPRVGVRREPPDGRVGAQPGDERRDAAAAGGVDLDPEVEPVLALEVGLEQVPAFG